MRQAIADALGRRSLTQAQLARTIGVHPQAVSQYVRGTRPIPAERAIQIEQALAGEVRVEDLRPDLTFVRDVHGSVVGYRTQSAQAA
jgi:DNA-binding transcriptional regulator YdaS (Cro superfamily)